LKIAGSNTPDVEQRETNFGRWLLRPGKQLKAMSRYIKINFLNSDRMELEGYFVTSTNVTQFLLTVNLVTCLTSKLRRAGVAQSVQWQDVFSSPPVKTCPGSHPISYLMITGVYFLDGNAAGAWIFSLSAEVQNAWTYTSTPPICLDGTVLN